MEFQQHLLASCTLAIIVFGCFGNVLSVMVFLKVWNGWSGIDVDVLAIHSLVRSPPNHFQFSLQRRSSINILLSALSLIDLCLLLFAVPVFVLPNLQCW